MCTAILEIERTPKNKRTHTYVHSNSGKREDPKEYENHINLNDNSSTTETMKPGNGGEGTRCWEIENHDSGAQQ